MTATRPLLIIFYRNPVLGRVKTRLAATLGDPAALRIYEALCDHTVEITRSLPVAKAVFYSDQVHQNDRWPANQYQKFIQTGGNLGERMANALKQGFKANYTSICIIGTDCYELSSDILTDAFRRLEQLDAVIGPARDGGYYLLGINAYQPVLFSEKQWSTPSVLQATVADFAGLQWEFKKLPLLQDVDEEEDLPAELRALSTR